MWTKNSFKRWVKGLAAQPKISRRQQLRVEGLEDRVTPTVVGPEFPALGGSSFSAAGTGSGRAGGRTFTFAFPNYNPSGVNDIFWGPQNVAAAGLDSTSTLITEANFDAGGSNLAGGVAKWLLNAVPTEIGGLTAQIRLTVSVTDTSSAPLALTSSLGAVPNNLTGDIGAVLKVQSAFKANLLYEARSEPGGSFQPLLDYYDANHTNLAGGGGRTSFSGAFWHDSDFKIGAGAKSGSAPDDGTPDAYTISKSGVNTVVTVNGGALFSVPSSSFTTLTLTGSSDADNVTIDYSGGDPLPASGLSFVGGTGTDTLTLTGYTGKAVAVTHSGPAAGTVAVGAGGAIQFSQTEALALNDDGTGLTVNLPTATNTSVLQHSGVAGTESLQSVGGTFTPTTFLAPTGLLTISGGLGNDTLRIVNPAAGLFAPTGGILYNGGGQAGDALENLGGTSTSGSYRVGPGNGDGVLTHVLGAATQTITFTGLAPAFDTVAGGTFTVFGTNAANTIVVDNGTVAGNIRVAVDAFESIELSNKTDIVIEGGATAADPADLNDTITVTVTQAITGLATLTVNGGTNDDTFNVTATPAGVTTTLNGGEGDDTFIVGFSTATLDAVLGPVAVVGGNNATAAGDTFTVRDQANAAVTSYGLSGTTVTRSGAAPVTVTVGGVEKAALIGGSAGNTFTVTGTPADDVTVNAGVGNDTFNVQATTTGKTIRLNGKAGTDTFNVSSNAPANTGDFAGLLGVMTLDSGDAAGTDVLNVNGTGAATAETVLVKLGSTNLLTSTSFNIAVAAGKLFGGGVNLSLGSGSDTVSVISTRAGEPVNVSTGAGTDSVVFSNGVTLQGGTAAGGLGTDTLDYSADTAGVAIDLGAGTATGTAGVSGFENATGGSGNDTLTGDVNANVLTGNSGNDTFVGGKGADVLSGGDGTDTFTWNNGDGSDTIDGGNNADTVIVNGNPALGNIFTVGANGTRVDFNRTSAVAFKLDIGTVETLSVNGGSAADSFAVSSLAGVADLTQINLTGNAGDDTFTITPTTVPVSIDGGAHAIADTLTVDAAGLAVTFNGTTSTITVAGKSAVTYTAVEFVAVANATAGVTFEGTAAADVLTVQRAGIDLRAIFNGANVIFSGAVTAAGAFTFNGNAGNDKLVVDFFGGVPVPAGGIVFNGGGQTSAPGDVLQISKGTFTNLTFNYTNASDGSVVADGKTITYSGLEPVDVTGSTATNLVINLPANAAAIVEDDSNPTDGVSRIRTLNGTFETSTFPNPSGSLTINAGGANAVQIAALDSTFATPVLAFNGLATTDVFQLAASNVLPDAAALTVTNATFDVSTKSETIGSLAGTGALTFGAAGTLTTGGNGTSTTYAGTVAGSIGSALVKVGAGTFSLTGSGNLFFGTLGANNGQLEVLNQFAGKALVAGGTLAGTGIVAGITAISGSVNPGPVGSTAPTTFTSTAAINLQAGSTFVANLGNSAFSGVSPSDRLQVTGTVTLGATLSLVAAPTTPSFGTQYVLIDNDGTDAVSGTFAGLPEGAFLTIGGVVFQVSYVGGTGNDVVLTAVPDLTISDLSQAEGNAGATSFTFTLTLSAASSQTIAVDYATADGSATTADGDYAAAFGTVTFLPGQTTRTVTVTVNGDTKFEGPETFVVNLANPVNVKLIDVANGTPNQAVGTILNDDTTPTASVAASSITEGNAGTKALTFTVTLSNASSTATVINFATTDGTATTADGDYVAPVAGTLTIPAGQTTGTFTVTVNGDTKFEADEAFTVALSGIGTPGGPAVGTILNDDTVPTIAVSDAVTAEGTSGVAVLTFTVTLSNPSDQTVTVNFATADGSATVADGDYFAATASVTFAPGVTSQVVTVNARGDRKFEGDESFALNLSNAVGGTIADGTGVGSILNDDFVPTVSVAFPAGSAFEGTGTATLFSFVVSLSAASSQPVTVTYTATNGTATLADGDFAATTGTLTFAPGVTSQVVTVSVTGDTKTELDETFALTLSAPAGATLGTAAATATILNDDAPPVVSIDSVARFEDAPTAFTFTVTLSNPSSTSVTVVYSTASGVGVTGATAGSDFTSTGGTVTFLPGEVSKTVTVAIAGDTTFETNETFTVGLSTPSGATLGASTGTGTILNDDARPSISVSDAAATEGTAPNTLTFTVTLSNLSTEAVTVNYAAAGVTATAGSDFTATSGTLTFAPGVTSLTVTVPVLNDATAEPTETLALNLSSATLSTIADGVGVGTILDDDLAPTATVAVAGPAAVSEGNAGLTPRTFTVTLSNPSSSTVTVNYATADGTATTADGDYVAATGTLTFAPGETTKAVTVYVVGDLKTESNEAFTLGLTGATNATASAAVATATITNDDALPTASIASASVTEGDAGTKTLSFTVTLSNPSDQTVTVSYVTADGTATTADFDYAAAAGSVSFAAGVTTQTFAVTVTGDTTFEPTEAFTATLNGATNATVPPATATATGTVLNDDTVPTISVSDAVITESDSGTVILTYRVTLSNASSVVVSANYATADGSATAADNDYVASAGSVFFNPGVTTQFVTVAVSGDRKFEGDETLTLNLSGAANGVVADGTGVGTIANDDAVPSASVAAPPAAPEGNVGLTPRTFTVTLSNPSSLTVTLNYATADGTATAADGDYQPVNGVLTFAPGEVTKTVTVYVVGDLKAESNEGFALNLSGPSNATVLSGTATAAVTNDDAPPAVTISDAAVNEGDAATAALTFTITLSNPSATAVTVNFATADGTATTADGDYLGTSGTLTFAPGQVTKTVTVPVNGDRTFEPSETLTVLLSGLTGGATLANGTGTGTVVNDDAAPNASVGDAAVAEGNAGTATLTFAVTLSNPSWVPVTVFYATADGSATAGSDYAAGFGSVTFAPGEVGKTVTVAVSGDASFEADETLTVALSNSTNAGLGRATGTGTILNDDAQPTASVGAASVAEGDAGAAALTFTVTLSNPSSQTVQVAYATGDGAATVADGDYLPANGLVTFAPGETTKTVTVTVNGDRKFEPTETVLLSLSGASNATVLAGLGTGQVVNDDAVPTASVADATVPEGSSGTTALLFVVTLSNPSSSTVTVNYATADGTANAGSDYDAATGTLTFAPGETTKAVTVTVRGDTLFEPDETLTLTLSGAANAGVARAQAVGTIVNDAGTPTLAVSNASVVEGNAGTSKLNFDLTLSRPSARPVTLSYRTVDGSAKAGSDYAALPPTTLTFAPGEVTKSVTVTVNGDRTFEPTESLSLQLSGVAGATPVPGGGVGTVVNDDASPALAIGSGGGNAPQVVTYDGTARTPQSSLTGADAAFTGGVRVASGDINNDGVADTVTTVGPGGGSTVRVRDGKTGLELQNFLAFEQSFTGGAYVAVGDFNGDGYADIVVSADEGGGSRVRVLDGKSGGVLADFLGIEDLGFRGGARVAVGDLNGDGLPDLVVGAGFGGGPRVAAFDGTSLRPGQAPVKLFADFFVFEESLRNGVFVAVGDITGDGFGELVFGGGPGGAPRVLAVSGADLVRSGGRQMTPVANFFAGDPAGRGGVRVALKDFDGDGRADLVAGSGDGLGSKVTVYRGSTVTPAGTPTVLDEFDAFPGLNGGVYVG